MPVCTSSIHSSAPCCVADLPGPRPGSRPAGRRRRSRPGSAPAPPRRPSSSTAAASAAASPYGTKITSPGSGAKGSRYLGLWVIASAPSERPWNAPSVAMILVRPVIRVILNAASLASVPELVKNTRASCAAGHRGQPPGQRDLGRGGEEVGDVAEGGDLAGDRRQHGGMGVPEGVDRQPGQQVEVACDRPRPRRGSPRRGRTPAWAGRRCSSPSARTPPAPAPSRAPDRPLELAAEGESSAVMTRSP